ncbi:beta-1,3-galactosyltransferase 6 [Teleopsis dalmanni]|uniref:beta-1,3-galactosyltransferase 6 n=1 Tax=Teleopsis dalmanni TaxID=139649 RepID=UPI0018CE26BB|nr:beta-1,3-galactosyltransferase 6 [Teleopsis dalmanni]XP_037957574.1 beta-1,3-galactosyltransferase 6 [Teleopsis dalmanni]
MRRMNNLVTLFTAMIAFFFGSFITRILTSVDKCPTLKSGLAKLEPHPELFLVILVLTAPSNIDKRQIMRDTWLHLGQPLKYPYYPEDFVYVPNFDKNGHLIMETVAEQEYRLRIYLDWLDGVQTTHNKRVIKIKHFFAIGTEGLNNNVRLDLEKEQKTYKDLLLLPRLQDVYANLTEKMLHAIDALTHHYKFSYLLKVDDDTYVKLDYLLNELVTYDRKLIRKATEYHTQPLPELYWGYFNGRANIKMKGQWSETNYYLSNRYITYALGGGYVISRHLCEFIANNSKHLSTYVSEDISVGTWLAPLRHVYRRHDSRFDTGYMPRKCRRQHMVLHKRTPTLMQDLYNEKLCSFNVANEEQYRRPPEYYYDWKKPAEKCCDNIVL